MTARYKPVYREGCEAHYHDTYSAYETAGCRCTAAREDHRLYRKRLREGRAESRMAPTWPSARRLQALCALGWTSVELGKRMDCRAAVVYKLATSDYATMFKSRVEAVNQVYAELCSTPGPSERCRGNARRNGWAPPFAWDNIDDPDEVPTGLWKPRKSKVNHADYDEVKFLADSGAHLMEIASRLGVVPATVVKSAERAGDRALARKLTRGTEWNHWRMAKSPQRKAS